MIRKVAVLLALGVLLTPNWAGAAGQRAIPLDSYEALVIPANSLVRLHHFNKDEDRADFSGQFVVTGTFIYEGCNFDECEGPLKDDELELYIIPDAGVVARLPHWKLHRNDVEILIQNPRAFVSAVVPPKTVAALRSGRLQQVTGRVAVVLDKFNISIECDSVQYWANFVGFAKPTRIEPVRIAGDFGCG